MRRLPRRALRAALLLGCAALGAWWLVKPVRLLAPGWAGLACPASGVCVEREADGPRAAQLYGEALAHVAQRLGPVKGRPRFVFCATSACAQTFGLGARSAVTVGTWGTVIGPHAWQPHYVRHELIHHAQAQRLGTLALLFKPAWLTEGMAYALSDDPRATLAAPWQGYRVQFQQWFQGVAPGTVWQRAGDVAR